MGISSYWRLLRAGFVLSREGAFSLINRNELKPGARLGLAVLRILERPSVRKTGRLDRLGRALHRLGPTYVKFGQTLATRPDIVGTKIALDLGSLHDAMEPFDEKKVPDILKNALGDRARDLVDISPPIAAASIAQVHKCHLVSKDGSRQTVAIKLLRPGIEERFRKDIESFFVAARLGEFFLPELKRLRPMDIVGVLERSAKLELDLRFEAASISEFGENIKNDKGFEIPEINWEHTAQKVLTTSWIEGIALNKIADLDRAGVDRKKLASNLMQNFLRHAIRDGLFHADMHPGNLFADPKTGNILAVDFGIMGRIGTKEQRFLAEILYGFITRNYQHIAQLHFDIGYVPKSQSVEEFALALRMIGEPMHGRKANDISMAQVFGQLFKVTELFNMAARPELILLQKNMALVEGVGRMLDPDMDIWSIAEPIVGNWIREKAGPKGKIEDVGEQVNRLLRAAQKFPEIVERANSILETHETEIKRRQEKTGRTGKIIILTIMALLLLLLWQVW